MKLKLGIFALAAVLLTVLAACTATEDVPPDASDSANPSKDGGSNVSDAPMPEYTTSGTLQGEVSIATAPADDIINMENSIVQTAEALIGIPFAENGASPSEGFDNSGFIYYVLRENGFINCPRFTADQAAMGTHIDYERLKSGDLAFFSTDDSGKADFGGIYIGEGQIIYSPMPGQDVRIADITSDYWKNAFYTGVSLS